MPEERYYVQPPPFPEFASSLAEGEGFPQFQAVRLMRPDWATDGMIHDMVTAITQWRYAHISRQLKIYVPRGWLTANDEARGTDQPGSLLGVPYEYADIPNLLVGVIVGD